MKSIRPGLTKNKKGIAWFLTGIIFMQNFLPLLVFATGGPSQPEFSRFEPYGATNLVNPFTGDFTYNANVLEIPGAHGGGYALSLAYHSGVSPEEDASWVGYGWSLNPGSINRDKRGFADDYDGQQVKYWNKVPANWTVSIGGELKVEGFSFEPSVNTKAGVSLRYNNRIGFGYTSLVNVGVGGLFGNLGNPSVLDRITLGIGYQRSGGEGRFSAHVSIAEDSEEITTQLGNITALKHPKFYTAFKTQMGHYSKRASASLAGGDYGLFTHSSASRSTAIAEYVGAAIDFEVNILGAPSPLPVGSVGGISGGYSIQRNKPSDLLKAYGYMYSGSAGPNDMMDYFVEKSGMYDKPDRFLGMPMNNADNFFLSGEGLGGGFRVYHKKLGTFHPNHKKSYTVIGNAGVEIQAGLNVGGGTDLGGGLHTLEATTWKKPGDTEDYKFATDNGEEDEPFFFRFNNDLGGSVEYAPDDRLINANVVEEGAHAATLLMNSSSLYLKANNGQRPGRSSYIAHHTNQEMSLSNTGGGIEGLKYKAYCRDAQVNQFVKRDGTGNPISKGIGEFAVFSEDGVRYVYGLPVYARNEINLQYDVKDATVHQNFVAYKDISVDDNLKMKVGEERPAPYAASYLLTEIVSPDYIDRTGDGASADDYGGYTKFNYTQLFGTKSPDNKSEGSDWFKWRVPFTGLNYERNEMSDPEDDAGTVAAGEREVYYLNSVETKTHIAYFVLGNTDFNTSPAGNGFKIKGSGEARLDGIEAADNVTAADNEMAKGTKRLQKLERIELYAKDVKTGNPVKLVKTVNFDYDYSLCPGIPNNINHGATNPSNVAKSGKLTLKRIWFEYEGIANALISPYVFEYAYPQSVSDSQPGYLATGYPSAYASFFNYGVNTIQNPAYSSFNVDAWGNYQYQGESRFQRFMPWLNQAPAPIQFDPAAWHLKVIKLPSKGELHVQYEQKTYSHVQDRQAMAMVSLLSSSTADKFYIDTQKIGVVTAAGKKELKDLMRQEFITNKKKIYFKFYYQLLGNGNISTTDGSCNAEFISGYATVNQIDIDQQGGLFVVVEGGNELPRNVCKDYVSTQRAGKLSLTGNCDASDGVDGNGEPADILMSFLGSLAVVAEQLAPLDGLTCTSLSLEDSYLRVPVVNKKGGGVRVKRLLTFDAGIEPGDVSLFGKEYIYDQKNPDTGRMQSTGVATTEPVTIREENALVGFMDRFKQEFLNRVVSGRDKEITEGPIGESLLPAPLIGYSNVVVKDIHNGKTNPGFTVYEHITAREYPFDMRYDHLPDGNKQGADFTSIDSEKDFRFIPALAVNFAVNNLWLSQGFRFVLNTMHGQLKSVTSYGGNYANPTTWIVNSKETYTYYEPGEKIPIQYDIHQPPVMESPGKEMDVTMELKAIEDIYNAGNAEVDANVGLFGAVPIPFVTAFPSYTYNESILSTHVTTTVIRYPALVKSVQSYTDGIYHVSKNTAFSPLNGQGLVATTTDGYDGLDLKESADHNGTFRSIGFPAAQKYTSMGPKYQNEKLTIRWKAGAPRIKKVPREAGGPALTLELPGSDAAGKLIPGDLIAIYRTTGELEGIYHLEVAKFPTKWDLLPTTIYKASANAADSLSIEVLRSGRTNELSASMGSVSTYGIPEIADLTTHSLGGVIGAQASTFSDNWRYPSDYVNGNWPPTPIAGHDNPYERGEKGKWRPSSSFTYKTSITPAQNAVLDNGTQAAIYNDAGIFSDFTLFNWDDVDANDSSKWIRANVITSYTAEGAPVMTHNVIDIYSCTKFGYNHTLPYIVAQNATAGQVQFEGFENTYTPAGGNTTYLEDGLIKNPASLIDPSVAHSGLSSLSLSRNSNSELKLNPVDIGQHKSFIVKVWVKENNATNTNIPVAKMQLHPTLKVGLYINNTVDRLPLQKIAQTGEWSLYETHIPEGRLQNISTFTPSIMYTAFLPNEIWIDDVRVQPLESSVTTYVYDKHTRRLLTVFDDQHFGLNFQYNAEGKLVRKMIETERGMKILEENQYNMPVVARDN